MYIFYPFARPHKNLSNFQLDKCRVGHPIPEDFLSKVCIEGSGNKYVMSFCKNIKKCVRAKKVNPLPNNFDLVGLIKV